MISATTGHIGASRHGGHQEEILWEQVKQLYRLAPLGFFATTMNAVIAYFVLRDAMPHRSLMLWLSALLVSTGLRIGNFLWFRHAQPELPSARIWKKRFLASLALVGVAWGSIGMVPFTFPLSYQVFIAFVLGGMAAGASSTFSKVRYGYAAYSIPVMLPLALHFFLTADGFHYAMGAMTLLYTVLLSRISWLNYTVNRDSLLLRFENQDMIESLKLAKEEVETLNTHLLAENHARLEAEAELRAQHGQLERLVRERTAELVQANDQLTKEIEERKQIEQVLLESQERLVLAQAKLTASKEAAEAGNLAKSEFLANMSHEMRTPLAGVLGMIKLVLDMKIGAEERQLLEMAKGSAESLLRIIADVLDFSRLEAGMMNFEKKLYSVSEVLRSAIEVVSLSAREQGLRLSWEVGDDLPEQLEGDPGRVRQVLVNLLGNAVKFTESGGIEVTVRRFQSTDAASDLQSPVASDLQSPDASDLRPRGAGEAGMVIFSVKDTGIGIAAEQLETIFGKFNQIDSSLTKRYGGTGLGLALSKQIVEKMGGRIWVESSSRGSTFYFTLPEHS